MSEFKSMVFKKDLLSGFAFLPLPARVDDAVHYLAICIIGSPVNPWITNKLNPTAVTPFVLVYHIAAT